MLLKTEETKIFFIGIGGVGMTPLALLLKENGYTVAGTDKKSSDNTEKLKKKGVPIYRDHQKENINGYNLVVYSSAIKSICPELVAAKELSVNIIHRSDLLAHFIEKHLSVTITGTHGKTTTSSLIDHMLNYKRNRAISILGGKSFACKENFDLKKSQFFVAEADESDGTFTKYKPQIALVTNIEEDHLDFYKNYNNIKSYFRKHIKNLKKTGTFIYNISDLTCKEIATKTSHKTISFGLTSDADVYAKNITVGENGTTFEIVTQHGSYHVTTSLIGIHNVLNTLGAFCVTLELNYPPMETLKSLESFKGVKRRLEIIYNSETVKIFDDYAHNPGKILSSLQSLKDHFPEYELVVLFQPHRISRLETMYKTLLSSLKHSDLVLVHQTYSAGENSCINISSEKIAKDLTSIYHKKAKPVYNIKEVLQQIPLGTQKKIIISSVGAGDIGRVAYKLRDHLQCNSSLLNRVS